MLERRYALSPQARLERRGDARLLVADSPPLRVGLNATAWRLLARLDGLTPLHALVSPLTADTIGFLEGLRGLGLLTAAYRPAALPGDPQAPGWPRVQVVVPVYARSPEPLRTCLAALAAQEYPAERWSLTVVDDGSPPGLREAVGPCAAGAEPIRWLRLDPNRGPASARNAAALAGVALHGVALHGAAPHGPGAGAAPPAEVVAFIDGDCVAEPDWLARLAAVLDDPFVAATGGRVLPWRSDRLLAAYEGECSSLHLGRSPGPVAGPGAVAAYLPSCNLAVKAAPFLAVGGFREGWRLGEDVDLCWRLAAAGQGLFYWPEARVRHRYRDRWPAFLQRKRQYAHSERMLRAHHPQRFGRAGPTPPRVALGLASAGLALLPGTLWGWSFPAGAAAFGGALLAGAAAVALAGALSGALWGAWRARGQGWPLRAVARARLRAEADAWLAEGRRRTRRALLAALALALLAPATLPLAALAFALGAGAERRARRLRLAWLPFVVGFGGECLAYSHGLWENRLHGLWRRLRGAPR
ncbi:MAG: glycosyltransferase [Candidatus Lambdaproteobacteria bacterium]|nr:glycosyltransferase [Candidatus Lambdaproteobacteria bacterium]